MAEKFSRYKYQPCLPLGEDGRRATASPAHIALSRRAAGEGMVLLENRAGALPLARGERVALFGNGCTDYVKGGGGSGDVYCPYVRNICDGLRIKRDEGRLSIFEPLNAFYEEYVAAEREKVLAALPDARAQAETATTEPEYCRALADMLFELQIPEPCLPDELFAAARAAADTAIITISRFSAEGWDRSSRRGIGDFYLTDAEAGLIERVSAAFTKTVVVLDVGGMVDTSWIADNAGISAVLLAWQGGMEGGAAVADVLCGDVNPSGRLTDTFAGCFEDYPYATAFNEADEYVDYTEDIYVGYRYFETLPGAAERVVYPFGYGLSYTTFALSELSGSDDGARITVAATVTNTGAVAGRQVVQVYYSAPQGVMGRPSRALAAFKKTRLLAPGESEALSVSFNIADMAAFDDVGRLEKSAWLLEKGGYEIYVGFSVRDTVKLDYEYHVTEDFTVLSRCESFCAPRGLEKRLRADGSLEKLPYCEKPVYPAPVRRSMQRPAQEYTYEKAKLECLSRLEGSVSDVIMLEQVGNGATMEQFLAQLTDVELVQLVGGQPNSGVSNTLCFGGLPRLGIPAAPTADGPAGVRLMEGCGVATTAWPCATLLACTWDTELMHEIGRAVALEVKENNLAIWLAPAINIHRNPLCGRNFEYYSEDPLLAGTMSASLVAGVQTQKVATCVKHLACNNKEVYRFESDSRLSERALREIYLRAFEICVKTAQPWSLMTSYNRINGVHASESAELITGILRGEWGFEGMVTSDWHNTADHVAEIKAGNDMKMPSGYPDMLLRAMEKGELTRAEVEKCVRRILETLLKLD